MTVLSLARVLAEVAKELGHAGHRWALIGGLAVSARTLPRFTYDADVAVSVADDDTASAVDHGRYFRITAERRDPVVLGRRARQSPVRVDAGEGVNASRQ